MRYDGEKRFCERCLIYVGTRHKCRDRSSSAIDGANTYAENEADRPISREPFHRSYGQRLSEGFDMLDFYDLVDSTEEK